VLVNYFRSGTLMNMKKRCWKHVLLN
jgi:hypothetical protein